MSATRRLAQGLLAIVLIVVASFFVATPAYAQDGGRPGEPVGGCSSGTVYDANRQGCFAGSSSSTTTAAPAAARRWLSDYCKAPTGNGYMTDAGGYTHCETPVKPAKPAVKPATNQPFVGGVTTYLRKTYVQYSYIVTQSPNWTGNTMGGYGWRYRKDQ